MCVLRVYRAASIFKYGCILEKKDTRGIMMVLGLSYGRNHTRLNSTRFSFLHDIITNYNYYYRGVENKPSSLQIGMKNSQGQRRCTHIFLGCCTFFFRRFFYIFPIIFFPVQEVTLNVSVTNERMYILFFFNFFPCTNRRTHKSGVHAPSISPSSKKRYNRVSVLNVERLYTQACKPGLFQLIINAYVRLPMLT